MAKGKITRRVLRHATQTDETTQTNFGDWKLVSTLIQAFNEASFPDDVVHHALYHNGTQVGRTFGNDELDQLAALLENRPYQVK